MKQSLPARPSLEHLKTQAKDLLAAAKAGDAAALARFEASLPSAPAAIALHDAQSVIAREHGFASWQALRDRVEEQANTRAIYAMHITVPLPQEVIDAAIATGAAPPATSIDVPRTLPLIALRNALLGVSAVAPLDIARPTSATAIAVAHADGDLVAVFSQRDPAVEEPLLADLHPIGVVARLVRVVPREQGMWIVVQGLAWLEIDDVQDAGTYRLARVRPFELIDDGGSAETAASLRSKVLSAIGSLPSPEPMRRRIEQMSPGELADATVANAPCPVAEKARYAAEPRLSRRLEQALAMMG